MTTEHPITPPPPELVEQIRRDALHGSKDQLDYELRMIHIAFRSGADQELEACIEWLWKHQYDIASVRIRAARRPKPPSLAEEALTALDQADEGLSESEWQQRSDTIRRALERLQELENNG